MGPNDESQTGRDAGDPPEHQDVVQADLEEIEDADPNPEPVSYTGTDFDVEGLVRRLDRDDILIPKFGGEAAAVETAGFQRNFVWRRPQMDRFIESLLLGYPIPGIFLVQQADKRYLVLDGHQRLQTLKDFYAGVHRGREFALENVGDRFKGLTYSSLNAEQRRALDNTFIQATIVRTDGSLSSLDAVYQVFERLNSGGTQLTAHEIRVALYAGPIIDFLADLNQDEAWRSLYGPESPRLRDQELVLRIVALYASPGTYRRPLKKYLNDFAARYRYLDDLPADAIRERFESCAALVQTNVGSAALRLGEGGQVNAALTEAVFVGLCRRLDAGPVRDTAAVKDAVDNMRKDEGLILAVSRATADEESVRTRLGVATRAFAAI
jgi:Protein of unknown function DUF262